MQIKTVLLADDDPNIRTVAEITLSDIGGWEVICAASGPEAIARAEKHHPDVILLDSMMPEMDGVATYHMLKSNPSTRDIPVIFVTAKAQQHELDEYLKLGAAGTITKPFNPMTLPDEIRRIIDSVLPGRVGG